jgi:hypothetical protein
MLLVSEGLKRELSESELAISQFHQTMEHHCDRAKASLQVLVNAMKDLLGLVNSRVEYALTGSLF